LFAFCFWLTSNGCGSAEVDKYFFPSYTHAQAQAFLENRPARSFLIRRSESEPGALTFVISYVKSSGNVKHHRLYYDDGLLTPQGSDESFSSIADLLYKKGFLGGGEFKLMPGNSDRQTPSPALVPRAPPVTQFVPQSRVPPAGPSRPPAVPSQQMPAPADNYARLNPLPQTQPTSATTHYANLGGVHGSNGFTEYSNLGAPDAPLHGTSVTSYGPVGAGAVPPPNYGSVQDTLGGAGDPTSNYSVLQNNHTPYTSMPSTDKR
jgi:hypothetical protein